MHLCKLAFQYFCFYLLTQASVRSGPILTSILSSCALRCPRGEYSLTLTRWKTRHRRCTQKYERQEMCLGICYFDRLHSFSQPTRCLWTKQKAGDDVSPPCKTLQNSFDLVCPLPVLLFKCCYSVKLGTPNQQSQVSLFQALEPQKGEHTEMCRLSSEFCS